MTEQWIYYKFWKKVTNKEHEVVLLTTTALSVVPLILYVHWLVNLTTSSVITLDHNFNESSKASFSHAHLAHVGHKALANFLHCANFSVSDRRQSATSGDYRRLSATVGDDRRQSTTIGDCRNVHERKRSKKSAPLGFHSCLPWRCGSYAFNLQL